jgi:hypothetical protein
MHQRANSINKIRPTTTSSRQHMHHCHVIIITASNIMVRPIHTTAHKQHGAQHGITNINPKSLNMVNSKVHITLHQTNSKQDSWTSWAELGF